MFKPQYTYAAKLVSVYDGDTIRVDLDLGLGVWVHNQPLRLYGIDTPELRGEERKRGLKVRDYVRARLSDRDLVVETIKDKTGKYGRWLAIVWIDGDNLNEELVRKGMAKEYLV